MLNKNELIMKKYILIVGFAYCVSCGPSNSRTAQQKSSQALKGRQTATARKDKGSKTAKQKEPEALKARQSLAAHKDKGSKTAKQEDLKVLKGPRPSTTYEGRSWYYESEETIPASVQQAVIDAFGWDHVIIKMSDGTTLKEATERADLYFTPQGCKKWDFNKLGKEFKADDDEKIKHISTGGLGILPYAIKGLLKGAQGSNIVVIVSTGVHDDLGVNDETEKYLKKLKKENKIGEYHILNSKKEVPNMHNKRVKDGKKVYTLLHTTC